LQGQMHIFLIKKNKHVTQFVSEFETLYGKNELTYNLHQLLHVTLNVR